VGLCLVGFHGLSSLFFFHMDLVPICRCPPIGLVAAVDVFPLVWLPRLMFSYWFGCRDSLVTTVDVYLAETGDVLSCESGKQLVSKAIFPEF